MGCGELARLSKEELIELVLRLQRPEKTSRTSSKPPSTARKEQRERAKPGGAKPGHEGPSRVISETPDAVVEHRREHSKLWGADGVGLGSRLTGRGWAGAETGVAGEAGCRTTARRDARDRGCSY